MTALHDSIVQWLSGNGVPI